MAKSEPSHKVVATPPMYGPLMRSINDSKVGAHLGQAKTIDRVKCCGFYWPSMISYTLQWVKICRVCARCKSPKHKIELPCKSTGSDLLQTDTRVIFVVHFPCQL